MTHLGGNPQLVLAKIEISTSGHNSSVSSAYRKLKEQYVDGNSSQQFILLFCLIFFFLELYEMSESWYVNVYLFRITGVPLENLL